MATCSIPVGGVQLVDIAAVRSLTLLQTFYFGRKRQCFGLPLLGCLLWSGGDNECRCACNTTYGRVEADDLLFCNDQIKQETARSLMGVLRVILREELMSLVLGFAICMLVFVLQLLANIKEHLVSTMAVNEARLLSSLPRMLHPSREYPLCAQLQPMP